jgi:hypothetical protein
MLLFSECQILGTSLRSFLGAGPPISQPEVIAAVVIRWLMD